MRSTYLIPGAELYLQRSKKLQSHAEAVRPQLQRLCVELLRLRRLAAQTGLAAQQFVEERQPTPLQRLGLK